LSNQTAALPEEKLKCSKTLQALWRGIKKPKTPQSEDKKYLSDFLNYQECLESNIFKNKSTYGFVLSLRPFSGISQTDISTLEKIIAHEIPSGSIVQVIMYASPNIRPLVETWVDAGSVCGIYKTLSEKRSRFFLSGCNLGLWGKGSEVILRNFELYFCISFDKGLSERDNDALLGKITEVRAKVAKAFASLGCLHEFWNANHLNNYLAEILNIQQETLKSGQNGHSTLLKFSSNPEYIQHPHFAEVKDGASTKKYLLFEVSEWPANWEIIKGINYVGNFDSGRGLGFPFFISFGYRSDSARDSEQKATRMRVIRTNQTTSKLVSFVPAMKEEMEDWHYITGEIDKGAKLASGCMYVVAIIDGVLNEAHASMSVIDHFYQLGFKLNQIKYDCLNNLLNLLPMQQAEHWNFLKKNKGLTTLITSAYSSLLPIFADAQNAQDPLMMLVGRRGQVFFFDNYASSANGNYNIVVVGKSGSGKSVFLQEYMTSILRQQGQIVVIDDGRSFQNSTQILGGDFVDFKGQLLCINPFSLCLDKKNFNIQDYKEDFEEPLIELIVSILCIVTNIDKNNTKSFEVGLYREILKKAVQIVLQEKGSTGGFRDIYLLLKDDSRLRTTQTKDIADQLAYVLEDYANSRYAPYYNGKATLSIDNLLTVFELSSLESNEVLQTSVLLMVVFLVYIKMQARTRRTSLIIDEAWRLLRHDAIKGFIEGIARRARKYNGSLIVATQSISDFAQSKSEAAAAVLSQSDWRILLSAESKDEKILKEQLGMGRGEVDIACSLKGEKGCFSEMMIRHSSSAWCIGRLNLDAFSAKLYSSKAEDVTQIQKLRAHGHSLEDAIEHLINEEKNAR